MSKNNLSEILEILKDLRAFNTLKHVQMNSLDGSIASEIRGWVKWKLEACRSIFFFKINFDYSHFLNLNTWNFSLNSSAFDMQYFDIEFILV